METVILGVILSGLFSLGGVWYATRSSAKSATFDTLVKAYEAVAKENERLRGSNEKALERIADLEAQLARAYGARRSGDDTKAA